MKLIIAGSRSIFVGEVFLNEIFKFYDIKATEIVSGRANGIDKSGECFQKWYNENEYNCSLKVFPADWDKNGKAAGPIRNKQMANYADALLLIWDGESRGSVNMKQNMEKLNKPVYEIILKTTKKSEA